MSASHRVLGTAYRIEPANVAHVRAYLDLRETNGYTLHETTFHPAQGSPDIRVFVYIGTPDNPQFCGPQDLQFLAERIYSSSGQSGLNRNYLYSLESALLYMNSEEADYHVTNLADRVRKLALLCSRECMG
ncbi:BgTH12-07953 [Blumeria graminis f. sp. triticale]|uniref:glutathione-specific gamma-glutamylcyclotransferase n=1 Tax=Blumeria graminis f. sp. triticale TaxID=1689686 RepID=A0A9W4GGI4_BLUGR|nr:BgTH12-07953 [Blumeria graminis f. sp. triticale]